MRVSVDESGHGEHPARVDDAVEVRGIGLPAGLDGFDFAAAHKDVLAVEDAGFGVGGDLQDFAVADEECGQGRTPVDKAKAQA